MAKRQKMSDTEANNERTILDYLNEDCWREVLGYVHAYDVIRTERASRCWQGVVLRYLQGIHISITMKKIRSRNKTDFNACTLDSSKYKSFESWTGKLGSSVVSTYCQNWESLEIIGVNCPNLETLTFFKFPDCALERFPHNLNKDFNKLKRLSFSECGVSDHCIRQFIADKALEELVFYYCNEVTGECLNTMNTSNLKTLVIVRGFKMSEKYIVPAVDRLGQLTRLKLHYVNQKIEEEIQFVLDKMPKLEQLEIINERIGCHAFKPLSRLTRLKHLDVSIQLGDDGIEAVTSCCKELRTLIVDCEGMTSEGAEALGRHGAGLTSLTLMGFFELDDDGVVAIVRGCTELEWLDVSGSSFLTPALPARAQAAWRATRPARCLKIDLSYTNLEHDEFLDNYGGEQYEEMKRQFEKMKRKFKDLLIVLEPEGED